MTDSDTHSKVVQYLLSFLLYGNAEAARQIGYTRSEEEAKKYKINILPSLLSPLWDKSKTWSDFYPEAERLITCKHLPADADLLSLVCFFVSNAEETVVKSRDNHGRLSGKDSLIGKHGLNMIPLVDEIARSLMKRLDLPAPEQTLTAVNLTHDVDTIAHFRHLRGAIGGVYRHQTAQVVKSIKSIHNDPAYTFPLINSLDSRLHDCGNVNQLYFIKAADGKGYDYPQYSLNGSDFRAFLYSEISGSPFFRSGANIGLHTAYNDRDMRRQKLTLENAVRSALSSPVTITANRFHYLRISNARLQQLADSGIKDDYSLAFADLAGFRLQTSRPVRWINPETLQLTSLTLHPLTVMDCTLSNDNYMNLSEEEAYYTTAQLIDKTRQNAGELTLLWHNTSFEQGQYHRSLYPAVLQYIEQVQ